MRIVVAQILVIMLISSSFSLPNDDSAATRFLALLARSGCAESQPVDHARTIEEVRHAHQWNDLLRDGPLATQERGGYFSVEDVLSKVDAWTPLIGCIAQEFDIPPELLAGLLATEMDLDYHWTDALVDGAIRSRIIPGEIFCFVAIGGGFGGVHNSQLRPALVTLGPEYSRSAFYRAYYRLVTTRTFSDLTRITTRYLPVDLTNAAVMARYYAMLRMGKRQMSQMTITDMAFVWSAYRGGVSGTPADPGDSYRWSLEYFVSADNPRLFGDTVIALPYFSYYHAVFGRKSA